MKTSEPGGMSRKKPVFWSTQQTGCDFPVFNLSNERDGPVIVTRLRAGRPGFDFRQGQGFLLLTTVSRTALGPTQPPIQRVIVSPSRGGGG
jgi:hypothetical protein